jgi:hypothetical protein
MQLKEQHFEIMSDIQKESPVTLNYIMENYIDGAFEAWKNLWDCCMHSQRD